LRTSHQSQTDDGWPAFASPYDRIGAIITVSQKATHLTLPVKIVSPKAWMARI
jgi:hypothetical protein